MVAFEAFVPWQEVLDRWMAGKSLVIQRDVTFWQEGREKLALDLVRPRAAGLFPAVIFVHGGGWRVEGNAFRSEIFSAAKHGYVAARIHYRLLDMENGHATHQFPTQLADLRSAIKWIRANAAELCVDENRIALVGMSAGGQLALLAGFREGADPAENASIKAIVNFYGPTDLLDGYVRHQASRALLETFLDGTPEEVPNQYLEASPVNFVSKDNPPVLTLHGEDDTTVPVQQAQLLDERMRAVGASHTLVVLPGETHGFTREGARQAHRLMYEFLDRNLHHNGLPDRRGEAAEVRTAQGDFLKAQSTSN